MVFYIAFRAVSVKFYFKKNRANCVFYNLFNKTRHSANHSLGILAFTLINAFGERHNTQTHGIRYIKSTHNIIQYGFVSRAAVRGGSRRRRRQ